MSQCVNAVVDKGENQWVVRWAAMVGCEEGVDELHEVPVGEVEETLCQVTQGPVVGGGSRCV